MFRIICTFSFLRIFFFFSIPLNTHIEFVQFKNTYSKTVLNTKASTRYDTGYEACQEVKKHVPRPNWFKIEVLLYELSYIISYAECSGKSISGIINPF